MKSYDDHRREELRAMRIIQGLKWVTLFLAAATIVLGCWLAITDPLPDDIRFEKAKIDRFIDGNYKK